MMETLDIDLNNRLYELTQKDLQKLLIDLLKNKDKKSLAKLISDDSFVNLSDLIKTLEKKNKPLLFKIINEPKEEKELRLPIENFVKNSLKYPHCDFEVPRLGTSPALAIDVIGSAGIATVFSSSDKIQSKKIKIGRKQVCVSGRSYCTKFEKTNPIKNIKVPLTGDYNILIIHGSLQGLNVSPSNPEMISQNPFSPDDIKKDLNYLALGHFHNYFKREHAGCCIVNPGSIERLSWAEINDSKGFVWAELGESKTSSEFVELDTRPMEIAELQLSKDEEYNPNIKDHIIDFLSKICDPQKILKLNLLGLLSQDQYGKLRANELLNACKDLFFNLQLNRRQLEVEGYGRVFLERIDNPVEAFKKRLDSLIAKNSQDDSERTLLEQVKSLGIKYLEMAK